MLEQHNLIAQMIKNSTKKRLKGKFYIIYA